MTIQKNNIKKPRSKTTAFKLKSLNVVNRFTESEQQKRRFPNRFIQLIYCIT